MLSINLVAALMIVRRRGLRREGIQPHVLQLLRIDGNRDSRSLLGIDIEIELRVRVEAFQLLVPLQRGKAIHRCPTNRYSIDCVMATLSLTSGPVYVIRGVADSMPINAAVAVSQTWNVCSES